MDASSAHASVVTTEDDVVDGALVPEELAAHPATLLVPLVYLAAQIRGDGQRLTNRRWPAVLLSVQRALNEQP